MKFGSHFYRLYTFIVNAHLMFSVYYAIRNQRIVINVCNVCNDISNLIFTDHEPYLGIYSDLKASIVHVELLAPNTFAFR